MSNAQGRGAGRQSGRGSSRGRDLSSFVNRGVIPTIGAFLMAGNGISSSQTATWCNKLKEYSIATFTTGVDEIFGANGSTGDFPILEDLADPVETGKKLPDKIAYKKWELELARNNAVEAKMKTEKTQLFGVMLGQMSDASKDLINECDLGRESFEDKCPLKLLKSIVLTHMANSRLGAEESLYSCNDHYNKLIMETNDTLSYYFHKMQSAISAMNEAHLRCGTDLSTLPDTSSQQAIKFIKCLSPKYEYFKSLFRNGIVEYPVTIEDAFTVTSTYNANNNDAQRSNNFSRHDMFISNGRGGRGGGRSSNSSSNRSNSSNSKYQFKPICYNCGREGHKSNDCRHPAVNKEDQDIAKAVAQQRKETVSKSGGPPGKK